MWYHHSCRTTPPDDLFRGLPVVERQGRAMILPLFPVSLRFHELFTGVDCSWSPQGFTNDAWKSEGSTRIGKSSAVAL